MTVAVIRNLLVFLVYTSLVACGGGGSSSGGNGGNTGGGTDPSMVTLSGTITFDKVNHNSESPYGLDYNNITQEPARGVTVVLLDSADNELSRTVTHEEDGSYSFQVSANSTVRVRVRAEIISTSGAQYDFKVTDNTSGNSIYVLQGSLVSVGSADSTRDLHAGSGWNATTNSYNDSARVAAPFAIIDTIYTTVRAFVDVDPDVIFPASEVRWSTRNRSVFGNLAEGEIFTSFYTSGEKVIYLLGAADSDTDEYDSHVIAHEWGHYFEDNLSRSDSIGGNHTQSSKLDMRLAFGEGWGNALAAMALDDSLYKDSLGNMQRSAISFDIENNENLVKGWYSEASVQSILYDIFDALDDGSDTLSDGLASIYDVMTSASYRSAEFFTSIHLFLTELKSAYPSLEIPIDALAAEQEIHVEDAVGTNEANSGSTRETVNAGVDSPLPIYRTIQIGTSETVCLNNAFGERNKLGNRAYFKLENVPFGNYDLAIVRISGGLTNPDVFGYQGGDIVIVGNSSVSNSELLVQTLSGTYLFDVTDSRLGSRGINESITQNCFSFTIANS
ncbi:hypothetical protein [Marinibactrum halimedae]|uniref:Lipoprotein n=1 Tax=Marinibactrum halimedae TaxID=1444977 RepID=A0AA37WL11_9GAMM|nr:hypothetical protein [Marinibactrum halimedae]MCD9457502.1 hypothetical protein [Marinibactrum halimedae]GLS25444.1 hypothetical protein GCM10007877_11580 [Marinibactrum halimedae]